MAIKNLFARGIGFTEGQVGWVVTRGYGAVASGTSTTRRGLPQRRRLTWLWFSAIVLALLAGCYGHLG